MYRLNTSWGHIYVKSDMETAVQLVKALRRSTYYVPKGYDLPEGHIKVEGLDDVSGYILDWNLSESYDNYLAGKAHKIDIEGLE